MRRAKATRNSSPPGFALLAGDARQEVEENVAKENVRDSYRRDRHCKEETPTRAVIDARLWNTTPVPAGAEPSDHEKTERRDGRAVRYVLERDAEGWKVVQAKYQSYASAEWSNWFYPWPHFLSELRISVSRRDPLPLSFHPNTDLRERLYIERVRDRTIHEMLGMVRGIVCDGVVSAEECGLFRNWVKANAKVVDTWPGNVLSRRILSVYEDGIVDVNERHELYELFCETVGAGGTEDSFARTMSSRLPLDEPPPEIVFAHRTFVLTGKFLYGPRSKCEKAIEARGGVCRATITKQPLTLVIGVLGSDAWIQSPYGRKIETAMRHKQSGIDIQIVNEEAWNVALERGL